MGVKFQSKEPLILTPHTPERALFGWWTNTTLETRLGEPVFGTHPIEVTTDGKALLAKTARPTPSLESR